MGEKYRCQQGILCTSQGYLGRLQKYKSTWLRAEAAKSMLKAPEYKYEVATNAFIMVLALGLSSKNRTAKCQPQCYGSALLGPPERGVPLEAPLCILLSMQAKPCYMAEQEF